MTHFIGIVVDESKHWHDWLRHDVLLPANTIQTDRSVYLSDRGVEYRRILTDGHLSDARGIEWTSIIFYHTSLGAGGRDQLRAMVR